MITGKQIIIDATTRSGKNLTNQAAIYSFLENVANFLDMRLIQPVINQSTTSVSISAIWKNAHVVIHTFSESKTLAIDLYTTEDFYSPYLYDLMRKTFDIDRHFTTTLIRYSDRHPKITHLEYDRKYWDRAKG